MTNYARMYRFGITPWERYATAAAASIAAQLDREESERSRPLGRALDLGCGRGRYTPELAHRGWEAVGIDYVPAAIEVAKAKSRGTDGLSYVVGDVTRLPSARLGTFDFFLDIGCFQGLDAGQRLAQGEGVGALANPGSTLLLLSFGPGRWRWLVEGASQEEVEAAFAGWEMLASEAADTTGLGWPMNKTAPRWYRLRRRI
jgi:SAM-dependent methyltransferase